MRVFALPHHITRTAALASCLERPEPRSRRPRRLRSPSWTPAMVTAVRDLRTDYPMWGKAKLTVVLNRQGMRISESRVGRSLSYLMRRGAVSKAPHLRRQAPRALRRQRPHAKRLPTGLKPSQPGQIVQLDTMTISRGGGRALFKQFTACDPVSRWTCAKACRRATAENARRFLDKLIADMPFPIQAIQVDGGSEFKAVFEAECQRRGIPPCALPPRSPQLNGHVERTNGAWHYEFYATWKLPDDLDRLNDWIDAFSDEFNRFRPHQALGGQTPVEYLSGRTDKQTRVSHM